MNQPLDKEVIDAFAWAGKQLEERKVKMCEALAQVVEYSRAISGRPTEPTADDELYTSLNLLAGFKESHDNRGANGNSRCWCTLCGAAVTILRRNRGRWTKTYGFRGESNPLKLRLPEGT